MAFTGILTAIASGVSELGLSPYWYAFLEGASMIVLTASVAPPMVQAADIDRIWFGIYQIIIVEMAQFATQSV